MAKTGAVLIGITLILIYTVERKCYTEVFSRRSGITLTSVKLAHPKQPPVVIIILRTILWLSPLLFQLDSFEFRAKTAEPEVDCFVTEDSSCWVLHSSIMKHCTVYFFRALLDVFQRSVFVLSLTVVYENFITQTQSRRDMRIQAREYDRLVSWVFTKPGARKGK